MSKAEWSDNQLNIEKAHKLFQPLTVFSALSNPNLVRLGLLGLLAVLGLLGGLPILPNDPNWPWGA